MKKLSFLTLHFFVSLLFLSSCASSKSEPNWIIDKNVDFPSSEYICFVGEGSSKDEARTKAVTDMSLYFNSEVTTSLKDEFSSLTEDDKNYVTQKVENQTEIKSSFALSGLQYEDYYSKKQKLWYSASYISRNTAWKQYVSEVDSSKDSFYALYNAASSKDALRASFWYAKSQEKAQEFLGKLVFAHVINPSKEKFTYQEDRKVISSIPLKIQECLEKVTLRLDMEGDSEGIIQSSLTSDFKDLGFTLSKGPASYVAHSVVSMNERQDGELYVSYPAINLQITFENETIYTFDTAVEDKTVSYNRERLVRTALAKLSSKIHEELQSDFKAKSSL